ncbi:hypothetical protein ACFFWC_27325 [Plantactinospora siamensis]|uniref:Uncharacterized protein n=1 Tax=Plantactinospora siamensis TaxID=555372 RepID=A0ABV6NZQ2_9ACTN
MPDTRTPELSFEVAGLPPIRTDGLSVFSAGHRQATRVRTLLAAACDAAQATGWRALTGPVALDLVLYCPPGHRISDAAQLLGGVGTVLQDKKRASAVGLAHLGVLVDVALYDDERQIRRLCYTEEPAADISYVIRVAALHPARPLAPASHHTVPSPPV